MKQGAFRIVPLSAAHERQHFCSGVEPLDHYFQQQVTQDIRRRITACFVALKDDDQIAGFYTLASASIPINDLPENLRKKLPRYPSIPAVLVERLAVGQHFRGIGLGGVLLADALDRTARADFAVYALVVDAKDDRAKSFYQHYGLIPFPDKPSVLFLPLSTVTELRK
jgi:GNAT superfamily N-acetyltransferase